MADYCHDVQDGAACCILANESFVHANQLENQAIELVAIGLETDYPEAFMGRSAMDSVGYGMTRRLADKVFAQAGAGRGDVGVIELHDCFAANEVRTSGICFCQCPEKTNFILVAYNLFGTRTVCHRRHTSLHRARGQHSRCGVSIYLHFLT